MKTLRMNLQEGDLLSLHPHDVLVYLRGICVDKLLFEGLTRMNPEGKISLAGAESLEISLDRLKYSFTLRDNFWSDGTLVTAYHYQKGFQEALSPHSRCPHANLLYMIKNAELAKQGKVGIDQIGVKAIDDKHLVIELEYPSPYLTELLAQPIAAPLIDGMDKPKRFNGPFTVATWEKEHLLKLTPNPHFWNRKEVQFQEIEFYMIPSADAAYEAFCKKEIDWVGAPLSPLSRELLHELKKENKLLEHPVDRSFWIYLNTEHPHLKSPLIRKALSLALDRKMVTEHILLGGDPIGKALSSNLLSVNSYLKPKENVEEAKQLFEKGLSELGLTKKNFPPLVISYAQQANRKEFAQYLQQRWSEVLGIQVELCQEEWNSLRANLSKGEFDVCAAFEASYYNDPLEIMERLGEKGVTNFSQWVHPEYRRMIAAASRTDDTQTRLEILGKAEKLLLEEMPFIPVCSDRLLFLHREGLTGYSFDSLGAIDLAYAFIEKERSH